MLKKIFFLTLAACLLLGGAAMVQPGTVSAAAAAVGVVDYGILINQHPDMSKANDALKAENEQAKKEFDSKAAGLSDKEKQELNLQLVQRVEEKRRELLKPILDQINVAVKTVADAKGLSIVVYSNSVVYGGQDITAEVGKKISD